MQDTKDDTTRSVAAIDSEQYLRLEQQRAERRVRAGWSRAYARQNQQLPYGGMFLSPGDTARLSEALARTAASADASPTECLGAALLSSIMTTGRGLDDILSVTLDDSSDAGPCPRGKLQTDPSWSWRLTPGAPSSPQLFGKKPTPGSAIRLAMIALPCSQRTRLLLSKMHRQLSIGGPAFPVDRDEANQALRRYVLRAGVKASTRRIEAWLYQRILLKPGGDAGVAALITGRTTPITQTVLHYTALETRDIAAHVESALADFDKIETAVIPDNGRIGSRFAPTLLEVQNLVAALARPLLPPGRGRKRDPVAVHNAMTTYTIALAQFATGCRPGQRLLPDDDAIDVGTGFLVVDDKPTRDNFKSRIVWVPPICRQQLANYRVHLSQLADVLPSVAGTVSSSNAPFYIEPDLTIRPVNRTALRAALDQHGWSYPLNAGRHFLRTSLATEVSTETLHAMLGHWHIGTEAWGNASALDPLAYRMNLAAALEPLLTRTGLLPRPGL